jgi:PAS domain-containing protein
MGEAIRAYDWAASPLGPPAAWPQPLKTAVRLLLSTRHPMFLWWGSELIQFYNDAYSHSLGPERHPGAIGQAGRECWAEIWDIVGPQIEQVMSGGEPTWHENALVPITRNGQREDVYWTYSYGPVDDETAPDGVGGVLVVCTETTQTVLAEQRRAAQVGRWQRLFEQAPSFICTLHGPEHVFAFVNAAHRRLFGSHEWVGKTIRQAFPDIADQGFYEFLDQVYRTGERLVFTATPVRYRLTPEELEEVRYLDFIYAPIVEDDGAISGIFCEGFDVTAAMTTSASLRDSE